MFKDEIIEMQGETIDELLKLIDAQNDVLKRLRKLLVKELL